ncbi:MAG: 50S ribosomal protein L24 [Rickettsiales bacterium]|jgi:large subunit ribosomal protein L24|nr:50S ribosomal protein L24 [Rickettsiales bacterium]
MKIKKNDEVVVISGKYKGAKGKVLEARPTESRVVVAGVNPRKFHIKPTQDKPGSIETRETPIHVSNVALIDPKSKKATKVGYKIADGKKVRVAKKSGTEMN